MILENICIGNRRCKGVRNTVYEIFYTTYTVYYSKTIILENKL